MRATGRTSSSHRDPSRPGRGGDRLDLSIASITHRLTAIRSRLARRLIGIAEDARYAERAQPAQSWLTPPHLMIARAEPAPWAVAHEAEDDGVVAFQADDLSLAYDPLAPSRVDVNASEPGLLVRTPRRPLGVQAEAAPLRPYASESVRFTRTPDPELRQRRQRALEAEREAQRQLELLREAEIAAHAAAQAAREAGEEEARRIEEIAAAAALQSLREEGDLGLPPWRRPFTPPPGVRFFRSPDRRKPAASQIAVAEGPVAGPEWSELGDGFGPQTWFGASDEEAIAYWFPRETAEAEPVRQADASPETGAPAVAFEALTEEVPAHDVPAPVVVALPAVPAAAIRRIPARPALPSMLARLARLAPMTAPVPVAPAPAPVAPRLSAMAARAAIRPAGAFSSSVPVEPVAAVVVVDEIARAPSPAPLTIPARPVLLRNPKGVPTQSVELAEEEIVLATEETFELDVVVEAVVEDVADVVAEPVNRPRAILPERTVLAPANRHLGVVNIANVDYELPSLELLAEPAPSGTEELDADELEQNALNLQQTVQDFGVRGDILAVRPGPVVTLYELEPAPGTKSSRVIGLSDDIARSMSAVSARVAVVPGRNVIGIELPNPVRETVYLRELLASVDFVATKHKLALCLGKNIGGEPIIADLARMPHLLVAGTTGSGKSVAINTMILSLLYRLKPEECRLIMVDPKMLELSVYDGIPHLLSPVVIDPKKAVIALKWAVREMEERYKKMSKVGVRNIDGYNARMKEAREKGETITRTLQTGFNRETGEAIFTEEAMDLCALPYIVIVVDEMADLMMVAGKDIEGAIQRLAQMARAAGIHLIMATQRPSVDVITGTIKANFPTRISFQVTSKIDSRTILGEMGAEQLLGQGDMLFMAGGGRTTRVHGPFCSDLEVEAVVDHLKRQGRPAYLDAVTADDSPAEPEKAAKGSRASKAEKEEFDAEEADAPVFDVGAFVAASGGEASDLYEQAIAVVLRDKKASTSYIQRRLQIGYNRAASIMERMELEGIVGPANHAGKREILVDGIPMPSSGYDDD